MLAFFLGLALAQDCPDPATELGRAESDIVSFYLADALQELDAAEQGFGCGPIASKEQIARWLVANALADYYGQASEGEDPLTDKVIASFAAAREIGPDVWSSDFPSGESAEQMAWRMARRDDGVGAVAFKGRYDDDIVAIDGEIVQTSEVDAGYHLVQVLQGDTARFARFVNVPADQSVVLELPVIEGREDQQTVVEGLIGVKKKPWEQPTDIPKPMAQVRLQTTAGVLGGVALAGFGSAVTFRILADNDAAPVPNSEYTDRAVDPVDRALVNSTYLTGVATASATAALTGTAVSLWILRMQKNKKEGK